MKIPLGKALETASDAGGSFFSFLHVRRAVTVPPPPPPSATGTVGADVPPASGRGRAGGQWGPGMGQEARRAMLGAGEHLSSLLPATGLSPSLSLLGALLGRREPRHRCRLSPDYYDAESLP